MHSIMKSCCMLIMLAGCLVYGQMNSNRQSSRQQLIPPRPVCANIGEYCQVASECCSKTCLSFSYRCVRGGPNIIVDQVPHIINKFAGRYDFRQCANDGQYCQIGQECCSGSCLSFSYRCVSVPKENTLRTISLSQISKNNKRYRRNQPQIIDAQVASRNTSCQAINEQCNSTMSCCTFLACTNANNTCITDNTGFVVGTESLGETLENRFGEEEAEPVKLPTVPCLELGAKCYQHDECCSLRCHSFLHQCVT